MPATIGILGFRPRRGTIIVTTLLVRGGQLTMIMLESDDGRWTTSVREGLAKLGADVALALDSVALTEDRLVRRSEARFRSLVQNSTDVVMIVERRTG